MHQPTKGVSHFIRQINYFCQKLQVYSSTFPSNVMIVCLIHVYANGPTIKIGEGIV